MTDDPTTIEDVERQPTRLALEFGEQIRDTREAAGLTQRELAVSMGTSQAAAARLEAGGTRATLLYLVTTLVTWI